MKKSLVFLFLSLYAASENFDSDTIILLDESVYADLLVEISSIGKPEKDPWMKNDEYQSLLSEFKSNYENPTKLFKVEWDEIGVPCYSYSTACYDVESEKIIINFTNIKGAETIINQTSKRSNYEGQTILQRNFDTTVSVEKIEYFHDKLIFHETGNIEMEVEVPLDDIKNNLQSFKTFLIFDINMLEDHELNYRTQSTREATISYPTEYITYSRKIFASLQKLIIEKNGEHFHSSRPQLSYIPVAWTQPAYPRKAKRKNISGYVIMGLSILKDGSVDDIEVLEGFCSDETGPNGGFDENGILINKYECNIFDESSMRASKKLKYKKQNEVIKNARHRYSYIIEIDS